MMKRSIHIWSTTWIHVFARDCYIVFDR
jgi:hypothetical protein